MEITNKIYTELVTLRTELRLQIQRYLLNGKFTRAMEYINKYDDCNNLMNNLDTFTYDIAQCPICVFSNMIKDKDTRHNCGACGFRTNIS